jgi:hypothetical protein
MQEAKKHVKKKLWWHTTYGEIVVLEQTYYLTQGGMLRPFKLSSGAKSRGYSMALQRVMADFGSDAAFAKTAKKIKEHYGIVVPISG